VIMTYLDQVSQGLCEKAQRISQNAASVLRLASLTPAQREDLEAVQKASEDFYTTLNNALPEFDQGDNTELLSQTRHHLRNCLNVVVGLTRILIRDLPDNLLLQMATVRTMHQNGQELMTEVDQLR